MSDYHSQRPPPGRSTMEYGTGSSASWIWALIILVALVALVAIGSSGGVDDGTGDGSAAAPPAAPAAEAPATQVIEE